MRPALLLPLLALAGIAPLRAETWQLDPVHTQLHLRVDHLGFTQAMGMLSIGGGELEFDPADWSSAHVDVRIKLDSLYLGDAKWQDTVKSWQFFNVKRWPEARFVSRSVEKTGDSKGTVHGELTLHGKTQPLDLAITLNKVGNDRYTFHHTAGFSATATFKRSAFGMDKLLSAVGDEVQLDIVVEAQRGKAKAGTDAPPSDQTQVSEENDGTTQ
jgi:polyisoprenoid-binding protein YceI